jgi:transcriptional regulator NrdR family protein
MTVCIKCGLWHTKVLQTRKRLDDGWVWRERRCDACGHRWGTLEVPEDDVRPATGGSPTIAEDSPC